MAAAVAGQRRGRGVRQRVNVREQRVPRARCRRRCAPYGSGWCWTRYCRRPAVRPPAGSWRAVCRRPHTASTPVGEFDVPPHIAGQRVEVWRRRRSGADDDTGTPPPLARRCRNGCCIVDRSSGHCFAVRRRTSASASSSSSRTGTKQRVAEQWQVAYIAPTPACRRSHTVRESRVVRPVVTLQACERHAVRRRAGDVPRRRAHIH